MAFGAFRFYSRRAAVFFSGILGWAAVQAGLLAQFGLSPEVAFTDAGLFTSALAIAAFACYNLLARYSPQSGRYGFAIGLSALGAWSSVWLGRQSVEPFFADAAYSHFLNQAQNVRLVVHFLWLMGITLGSMLAEDSRQKKAEVDREQDAKNFVKEAELQKLQLQLQPHFLFNSLNSIHALTLSDPDKARGMIEQLSDFLRATLKRADEQWISLEAEFRYLTLYLTIEKVRFGHRLHVHADLDEQLKIWLIPPLILQPLVENAVKFGLYGTTDQVEIRMAISRIDDHLQIEISNPFDSDVQPASGTGFGLQGLKRRLYLLYARNDLLQTRIEGNLFIVQLTLPERYEGDFDR